ncbi:hypothetical protein ACLOJK_041600 [Asimina triloba]
MIHHHPSSSDPDRGRYADRDRKTSHQTHIRPASLESLSLRLKDRSIHLLLPKSISLSLSLSSVHLSACLQASFERKEEDVICTCLILIAVLIGLLFGFGVFKKGFHKINDALHADVATSAAGRPADYRLGLGLGAPVPF